MNRIDSGVPQKAMRIGTLTTSYDAEENLFLFPMNEQVAGGGLILIYEWCE